MFLKISNKRLLVSVAFLLLLGKIFAQGILEHPRKVYKLATQYFDILFADESSPTAYLLAQKADEIYLETKDENPLDYDFRMPVIISPDSQIFSVEYTSSPYNRIIIFEGTGLASDDKFLLYECFKREVAIAQLQSIRSKGSKIIGKVMNGFTPVSLIHLPDSFLQSAGRIYISSSVTDKQALQLLTQAKIENKFPSWFQCISKRDIYPGNDVYIAANSAFSAFLIQTYGIEKYDYFWELCGEINLLFIGGVFNKAYEKSISDLWKEFEESIPVPENLEQITAYEKCAATIFPNDKEASYDFIIASDYGLIWYDEIKKEVDFYDENSEYKIRELLFLAQDVTKLSISDDQRYLSVSYKQNGYRKNFVSLKTEIYDLQQRCFLKQSYNLTDSTIVTLRDGSFAIAGFTEEENETVLKIINMKKNATEEDVVFSKAFSSDCLPSNPVSLENGILYYLLTDKSAKNIDDINSQILCCVNYETGEETYYSLPYRIFNLKKDKKNSRKKNILTFNYFDSSVSAVSKIGYIEFENSGHAEERLEVAEFNTGVVEFNTGAADDISDSEDEIFDAPENILPPADNTFRKSTEISSADFYFQTADFIGGVNSFSFMNGKIYYCSKKFSYCKLNVINSIYMPFAKTTIAACTDEELNLLAVNIEEPEHLFINVEKNPETKKKTLGEYQLGTYVPFAYFFPPSVIPLVAIKEISLDSGVTLAPAIGLTLRTGADPFDNTRITLSTSAGLANLSYQKIFTKKFTEYTDFSSNSIRDIVDINNSQKKNISAVAYIENFSTPIDIRLASSFRFSTKGEYDFLALAGTSWTIPFRMNFRNLTIGINGYYSASTDYYDPTLTYYNPPKQDWPSFDQAYQVALVWTGIEYSNIHQYGISKYEQRGLSVGAKLYSFWDINEIRLLKAYKAELEKQLQEGEAEKKKNQAQGNSGGGENPGTQPENKSEQEVLNSSEYNLTQAQIDEIYNQKMLDISQFNLSLFADIKIPRLTPLKMHSGWVLSVPTSIHAEFLKENGNALNVCIESLLIGKEIQNGIPFTQIFFYRSGLKFGYDFNLNYDTSKVQLPDIRRKNYIGTLLANTYVSDSLYLLLDMDFSSPIGVISKIQFSGSAKFEFFPRTAAYKLGLVLNAHF